MHSFDTVLAIQGARRIQNPVADICAIRGFKQEGKFHVLRQDVQHHIEAEVKASVCQIHSGLRRPKDAEKSARSYKSESSGEPSGIQMYVLSTVMDASPSYKG